MAMILAPRMIPPPPPEPYEYRPARRSTPLPKPSPLRQSRPLPEWTVWLFIFGPVVLGALVIAILFMLLGGPADFFSANQF